MPQSKEITDPIGSAIIGTVMVAIGIGKVVKKVVEKTGETVGKVLEGSTKK